MAVWTALKNKVLDFPFCLIHSDMVLCHPVEKQEKDIVFSNQQETVSLCQKIVSNYYRITTPPVGDVMVFNENVPVYFFERLNYNFLRLIEEKFDEKIIEKAAWAITIIEGFGGLFSEKLTVGFAELEGNLLYHNYETNFIHYKNGLGSDWNKHQFKYKGPVLNESGPFHSLLGLNTTSSIDYICKLIEKII